MNNGNPGGFGHFLKGHLFSTIFWWLPIFSVCISRSFLELIVFLSFFTSFTFWQWEKYQEPVRFKIYKISRLIEGGYFVSTGLFLFLTGKYVYDGLMSNYVTHRSEQGFYVFLYATAITLLLVTVTYMIKTGRNWIMLALVYLLFDLPGAMPFNFLHFYENQKINSRLDIDKTLVEEIKIKCDSVIRPKVLVSKLIIKQDSGVYKGYEDAANKQLALNKKAMDDQRQAYREIDSIVNSDVRRTARTSVSGKFQTTNVVVPVNDMLVKEIAENEAIINALEPLIAALDTTGVLIRKMKSTNDREVQLFIVENIKSKLQDVCSSSGDTSLQKIARNLVPNEPTQLESIEAIYVYVGKKVFGLRNSDPMNKRTERVILMSLVPSVIIDLLPLIFSIVYARWCRNNDEA